jgi:hypothetical protein
MPDSLAGIDRQGNLLVLVQTVSYTTGALVREEGSSLS